MLSLVYLKIYLVLFRPLGIFRKKNRHSGSVLKKSVQIQQNRYFDIRFFNLFLKTSILGVSENV
jgi:hypothetical protein